MASTSTVTPCPKKATRRSDTCGSTAARCFGSSLLPGGFILRRGFQVIQGCNPPDDIFLVPLPFKLFGVKYIFDHHDANPELYLSKYEKRDCFTRSRSGWRSRHTASATSSWPPTAAIGSLPYPAAAWIREDVFVVRNGPDLKTFKRRASESDAEAWQAVLVGYVGTMSVQEGLDILLRCGASTSRTWDAATSISLASAAGRGWPGLRKMTHDEGLEDIVNFTGSIPDQELLEILSTADVCVNPDKPCEMNDISTMIKIMEYMALGKPIVQFDLKEGRFSAQDASFYANNQNQVPDFAAKILWLLDNPEQRQRMGEFGRKRVAEALAWEYSVENLLAAYDRVFRRRGSERNASQASKIGMREPG